MRITNIEFRWNDIDGVVETAPVCILNDPALYESLANDDAFDEGVFFYFQDEAEFQSAFDELNCEFEFTIIREID